MPQILNHRYVSNDKTSREKCTLAEFRLMEIHATQFSSPDWVAELGDTTTILMGAIWNKVNLTELHNDIKSYFQELTNISTNKEHVSRGILFLSMLARKFC